MNITLEELRGKFDAWYGPEYSEYALKTWYIDHYSNIDTELAWRAYQEGFAEASSGAQPYCLVKE